MDVNVEVPKLGKDLLGRLNSKEITMEEFDRECAYWMLQYLNDYRWLPSPTIPNELTDYWRRRQINNKTDVSEAFWQKPVIKKYIATEAHIRATNLGSMHWLKFMKKHIPQDDVVNQKRIDAVIWKYPKLDV